MLSRPHAPNHMSNIESRLPSPEPWISVQGQLCENPLWDAREQILYWTDIPAGRIYSHDWKNGLTQPIYEGPVVGGFTQQEDGSLLLFRENDIVRRSADGSVEVLREIHESGDTRFNDVIADPEGRVFAGTIGRTPESGSLYRIDLDGSHHRVATGTACANGLAFSPDLKTLYWVCSTRRKIFSFPYNRQTGALGEASILFEAGADDGTPDGLTIDREGNLYSIRWEAPEYGLVMLDLEGRVLDRVRIPAKATTSACFCGPDLRHLAVTSAQINGENRPSDLFLLKDMPIAGRVEFRSRILC